MRKPHNNFVGYVAELRNKFSGGHTIILDCKKAQDQGNALVQDYKEEGGRWQTLCNEHSTVNHSMSIIGARLCMKHPDMFCDECRKIAGEK